MRWACVAMKREINVSTQHFQYTEQFDLSQNAFNPLPAVVIGGPPHSGKSVLTYSLTRRLRELGVAHYVLRAYPPDGEGDWFYEGPPEEVRHLRVKGARSEAWLPLLQRDIARRHLPLILDVGGLPTLEQEALFDLATHGVLLTPDAESHAAWAARFARHGLVLLADLHSELHGEEALAETMPVLRGTLAGLERRSVAGGPAFAALVERLSGIFRDASSGLPRRHLADAPVELAVDLAQLAAHFGRDPNAWLPQDLPAILDYLPEGRPLALYGRAPNWLCAAVALHALPEAFWIFDARLGWTAAPVLARGPVKAAAMLQVEVEARPENTRVTFSLPDAYLDITEVADLTLPPLSGNELWLSGKLSLWLWAAVVRTLDAPAIAVHQPRAGGAIVVRQRGAGPPVGSVL